MCAGTNTISTHSGPGPDLAVDDDHVGVGHAAAALAVDADCHPRVLLRVGQVGCLREVSAGDVSGAWRVRVGRRVGGDRSVWVRGVWWVA